MLIHIAVGLIEPMLLLVDRSLHEQLDERLLRGVIEG